MRDASINTTLDAVKPRTGEWRRFRRVFLGRPVVTFGLAVIVIFVLVAIFAPLLTTYNPTEPDMSHTLVQSSKAHLLGTDAIGRDVLSRIIYGSRTSLMIGLTVVFCSGAVGITLGTIAGYYGGWIHTVIMRLIDALMSFPMIILALLVAAVLGGGMKNVIVALSVAMMPAYSRLMCGQVITVRENDYIQAERSIGSRNFRIMLYHIVPNCLPPLIVMVTMQLGVAILSEAGLSFLGIGITPPTPAWGSMVNDGREYLLTNPILSFTPGLAIMLVVFAFNMAGDGLRDALDPRLRGTL